MVGLVSRNAARDYTRTPWILCAVFAIWALPKGSANNVANRFHSFYSVNRM